MLNMKIASSVGDGGGHRVACFGLRNDVGVGVGSRTPLTAQLKQPTGDQG